MFKLGAFSLVLSLLALVATACGGDDTAPTPTPALPITPTAVATSAPSGTPSPVATSPVPITPTAVATSVVGATPTAVAAAGCPAGWTAQNVAARSYHFCTPPGWTVQQVSAASSMATPVPAGGSLASEPVGSLVLVLSPEQGSNTTPGVVNKGSLIRIYMTAIQVSFALPGAPLCSGAAGGVAGRATSICSLDNTAAATNPYRLQEWISQPSNPTISVQSFTGKDVPAADSMLSTQVVGTIRFN
jgi:hypothetical protein